MTPAQTEAYELKQLGYTQREISEQLGKSRRTVRDLIQRAEKSVEAQENRDPAVQLAMDEFGTKMEPDTVWLKTKDYSVQLRPKKADDVDFVDRVAAAFKDIPLAPPINAPTTTMKDHMVVYPLFDVHLGMRAHATISGEEVDLDTAKNRLIYGLSQVMAGAPAAYRAVIINGGDFTHQTDDMNKTRRSGHVLDVDGRNIFTVMEAIETIAATIEMALSKHMIVEYYSVPGNHDPQNWETILLGLRERYREHDRVHIYCNFTDDNYSNEFSVVEHGEVALFIHHGEKRTPKDLCMFVAAEFPEVWGRTRYRTLLTGHLHHLKLDEFPGIYWMQMPAIAPRDAHAAGGYHSHSKLMAIGYDRESEVSRNTMRLK